jgi:8-oxo-dGTP pyrophosphatase MutT (NUDIX family)
MSYITIYFGEKPVYLCDSLPPEIEEVRHHPDAIFIDELSNPAINSLLHEINKTQFHAGIILHENLKRLRKAFFKHFDLVKAAGGLVINRSGEVLVMFRKGKWDLPKGKLDNKESLLECAIREVQEETGLQNIKAGNEIETTYHTYTEFGKQMLKETHWFHLKSESGDMLNPQVEEGITEVKWVKKESLPKYLENTYPSIKTVLKSV